MFEAGTSTIARRDPKCGRAWRARRPAPERAAEYRAACWWRDVTFLDDLAHWAQDCPDHPAIIDYEDGRLARIVTYSELAVLVAVRYRLTAADVVSIPQYLTHVAAGGHAVFAPIFLGATCVTHDTNDDMDLMLDLVAARGMTETGGCTTTGPQDPPDWGAHGDGPPSPWKQVRVAAADSQGTGRLLVRGASLCLGYLGQPEVFASCVDQDGWFDTGDMARDEARTRSPRSSCPTASRPPWLT